MRIYHLIIPFLFWGISLNQCIGQSSDILQSSSSTNNKWFIGGNFGLQFGTVTLIDASPSIGYWVQPKWAIGLGINYQYYYDSRWNPAFSTSIYGGNVFSRYYFFENIFAHAEFQLLNYETILTDPYGIFNKSGRINEAYVLIGGGYRQNLGGSLFVTLSALYNFNETPYTLYQNPIFRIGFDVGF